MVLALLVVALVAAPYTALIRAARHAARNPWMLAPRVRVSTAYPHLATGDIILFAAANRSIGNTATNQEYFSHAAFVLREGGLFYTSEASPGGHFMPAASLDPLAPYYGMVKGAALYPFLPRLKYYGGQCFLLKLTPPLSPAEEDAAKVEAEALSRAAYAYPTTWQVVLSALGRAVPARHCFEHVAHLVDTAGLTPADGGGPLARRGPLATCREVCALPGRPLAGGRRYSPPVQLIYDLDLE